VQLCNTSTSVAECNIVLLIDSAELL